MKVKQTLKSIVENFDFIYCKNQELFYEIESFYFYHAFFEHFRFCSIQRRGIAKNSGQADDRRADELSAGKAR